MQSAAKVGFLLVVFALLFVAAFSVLGRTFFAKATDVYYAEFADAGGIKVGTQVLMAGVQVGEVSEVRLVSPTLAKMTLQLDKGMRVPVGSDAEIPSSLVGIGQSPVSIVAPPTSSRGFLPVGATLVGRKPSPLDNILPNGQAAVAELTKTMKAFRLILENQKFQHHVDDLLVTTNQTVKNVGDLSQRFDRLLGQNQATLAAALNNANQALVDVKKITAQVVSIAGDPRLHNDAVAILGQVKQTVTRVNGLVLDVDNLMNDPKVRGPIKQSVQNVADITETGKRIADNTERMTANGAVISEKAIGLTDQVSAIAGKANDIAEDVKTLTQRVSGILNPKPKPGLLSQLSVGMDLFRESNPSYWRTDVDATLPFQTNIIHVGIRDAFESNKFTFQLGNRINPQLEYRYGVFGGRAGIGVDYLVAPRVTMRGDLWDLNDPRLDVRAGYDFGNGLIGWLGFDRLFGDNAATVGIGVRK